MAILERAPTTLQTKRSQNNKITTLSGDFVINFKRVFNYFLLLV